MVLNQTRVYYYSDPAQCAAFLTDVPGAWRRLGFNDSVQVLPEQHEADLNGVHRFRRPITDIVINETGADGIGAAALVAFPPSHSCRGVMQCAARVLALSKLGGKCQRSRHSLRGCVLRPCSCMRPCQQHPPVPAAHRADDGAACAHAVGSAAFVTQDIKCFCPLVNPWPLALPPGSQPPAAAPGASNSPPAPSPAGNLSAAGVAAAGPGDAPAGSGRQGGGLSQVGAL